MRSVRAWWLRLLGVFDRRRSEREMAEELESHLQFHIDDGIRSGLSPEEARRRALVRLGGVEVVKEACRDRRGVPLVESLIGDLRYAARTMRSHPAFTATVILTLGLGIGATTAIFTVVNGVLLRPLPYPQPDRLVYISGEFDGRPHQFTYVGNYSAFRDHSRTLSQIAGYLWFEANFSQADRSERLTGMLATRSLFELLAVRPVLGRNFLAEEDAPGGSPAVLLSHSFWRRRFGADRSVIGRSISLDGKSYAIVGVLPPGFRAPGDSIEYSVWAPFAIRGMMGARNQIMLQAVGRLKDGITLAQAAADLNTLERMKLRGGLKERILVSAWQSEITRSSRTSLLIFAGAVALVLLIACVNVANLLLARAASREKEIAVRRVIGAGRRRIVQQLLTESALMGILGGAAGLVLAYWGKGVLIAFLGSHLPTVEPIRIDGRVLLFNLGTALLTGFAFGLAPALEVSRPDMVGSLKESGRGASEGRPRHRLRSLLVISEVAMAMVLLSGAGLLFRSFLRMRGVEPGYRQDHVLTMTIDLTPSQYATTDRQAEFFRRVLERIEGIPGVASASAATSPPFSGYSFSVNDLTFEGVSQQGRDSGGVVVSPGYIETLGIPLVGGRTLSAADRAGSPSVVLVNESFVRQFCPNMDCIGRRMQNWDKDDDQMTIVGVVRDISVYPGEPITPEIYASCLQMGGMHMTLVVRTAGDPMAMSAAVQARIAEVDKTQPPHDIKTLEAAMANSLAPRRVKMIPAVAFALLALGLGAIGIYGVLSYSVKCRTHEIGVRLALGAERAEILRLVLRSGMAMVGVGIAAGAAASLGLTRYMASELWGVTATDPWTFAATALVLVASGVAACLAPALRAARIDPMASLRCE